VSIVNAKRELEREIEKKRAEIRNLQEQVRNLHTKIKEADSYILGIQRAIKILPVDVIERVQEKTLRHGSDAAKSRDALQAAGKPLHVIEILNAIGKPNTKPNRISLSGSLAHYSNAGQIFKKTAPRTFTLIDMAGEDSEQLQQKGGKTTLPPDFGSNAKEEEEETLYFTEEVEDVEFDETDPFAEE